MSRRILHHGATPDGTPTLLSDEVLTRCWFELHRLGGCGAAELELTTRFIDRQEVEIGDWFSFEMTAGSPLYLGRVEERRSQSPAKIQLRLQGMAAQLNEVFPGGFGSAADGVPPHRFAGTDLFADDPDRQIETIDSVNSVSDVLSRMLTQYVIPNTNIQFNPALFETPDPAGAVTSLKLRGEESVRAVIKELALRAGSASWGVNARGEFYFLNPPETTSVTYQEGLDVASLHETRDYEFLYNRLLLTGDYIYDSRDNSANIARRSYRWRANYIEPNSQSQFGDRRLRIWIPWIRTQTDAVSFAREFFRTYSQPTSRFLVETAGLPTTVPIPWETQVQVLDQQGQPLVSSRLETIRVNFDHVATARMELGPEDPRTLWPEPPHDERWELPDQLASGGGQVSVTAPLPSFPQPPGGGGGPGNSSNNPPSISSLGSLGSSASSASSASSDGSLSSDTSSASDVSSSSPTASSLPMTSTGSSAVASSLQASSAAASSGGSTHSTIISSGIASDSSGSGPSEMSSNDSWGSSSVLNPSSENSAAISSSAPANSSNSTSAVSMDSTMPTGASISIGSDQSSLGGESNPLSSLVTDNTLSLSSNQSNSSIELNTSQGSSTPLSQGSLMPSSSVDNSPSASTNGISHSTSGLISSGNPTSLMDSAMSDGGSAAGSGIAGSSVFVSSGGNAGSSSLQLQSSQAPMSSQANSTSWTSASLGSESISSQPLSSETVSSWISWP